MSSQFSSDLSLRGRADVVGRCAAWIAAHADRILCVGIFAALLIRFVFVWRIAVNWDEFYFLELVHPYARGELTIRPHGPRPARSSLLASSWRCCRAAARR